MPDIREYRVVLPMTVDEYCRGREWHKVEKMKMDTKFVREVPGYDLSEESLLSETTDHVPFTGQAVPISAEHTIKRYDGVANKPGILGQSFNCFASFTEVMLTNAMKITEIETWDAYPYHRSVSKNIRVSDTYRMTIEAVYLPGNENLENALHLPGALLEKRQVVHVDIAAGVAKEDYRDGKDPALFVSSKTERGPLQPGIWRSNTEPCMTCYFVVMIDFDIFGVGRFAEKWLHAGILRSLVLHHRELYCCIDSWIDLDRDTIRASEIEAEVELHEAIAARDAPSKPLEQGGGDADKGQAAPSCCPISKMACGLCGLFSGDRNFRILAGLVTFAGGLAAAYYILPIIDATEIFDSIPKFF